MGKLRVLGELVEFLRMQKKYWLVPLVVIFALVGMLLIAAQSTPLAPFIYTLF